MSLAVNRLQKPKSRPKTSLPRHATGAATVALFAAAWTQAVAAITLVLMWFAWQDPLNLAWPDPDRLILMALTHLSVLIVSIVLSSRFGRRRAAERDAFREIWWTGGAAAGTWFGLPLYLSVTWDHLVYGGHDAGTIVTVGLLFMIVGGMLGGGLALVSEPAARWLYERVQGRPKNRSWHTIFWLATPFTILLGAGLTLLGLGFGPRPVADPLYPGATHAAGRTVAYGCQATLDRYTTPDGPTQVLNYYRQLATNNSYYQVTSPGQLEVETVVPSEVRQVVVEPTTTAVVRYSNNSFRSRAEAFDVAADACRSIRVYLSPATGSNGTTIQIVRERPLHLHPTA